MSSNDSAPDGGATTFLKQDNTSSQLSRELEMAEVNRDSNRTYYRSFQIIRISYSK